MFADLPLHENDLMVLHFTLREVAMDRMMLAVVVLDVRQSEEFIACPGHLPGASNMPLPDLPGRIWELAAGQRPIVLICKTDRRSARTATELLAAGLRDVAVLRGGTDGWHCQGLGLE